MQKIAIVPNTNDPVKTLQLQFYTEVTKVVDRVTSLQDIEAEIAADTAQIDGLIAARDAKQAQYDDFVAQLAAQGVTDLTQPLSQKQIDDTTTEGLTTDGV